jgi:hypothetical protein
MPATIPAYEDQLEVVDPNDPSRQIAGGQSVPRFLGPGHAILGTRQIDMPIQTSNPTRAEWNAFQAEQQAPYLKAKQDYEDQMLMRQMIEKSAGVQNQLKAITEVQKFMEMRRLGSLLQEGIQKGLPHSQALAAALVGTPGIAGRNLSGSAAVMRAADISSRPGPQLGGVSVVYDPLTQQRRGLAFQGGKESRSFIPDLNDTATKKERAYELKSAVEMLQQRVRQAEDMEDPTLPSLQSQLNSTMEEYLRLVGVGQGARPGAVSVPDAIPAPAVGQPRRWNAKTGRLEPRQ